MLMMDDVCTAAEEDMHPVVEMLMIWCRDPHFLFPFLFPLEGREGERGTGFGPIPR